MSNWGHMQRATDASYCLGQPPHLVAYGKIICEICGHLVSGATLGIYQVQQLLGRGRSGNAYLAQHHRRQTQVVMKVFPPDKATMGLWETARQEALFLTRLQHPHLLPVWSCTFAQLEVHTADVRSLEISSFSSVERENVYLLTVRPFVVSTLSQFLEYLGQQETSATAKDDRMLLLKIIKQMGETLSFVHGYGRVHGAPVPGNMLVDSRANCWIADFGLARLHTPPPPYLPPEFLFALNIDQPAERFITLWNATTPLSDQYMFAMLCQNMLSGYLFPQNYDVGARVLQRATAPHPEDRFPSIDAFVKALIEAIPARKRLPASDKTFNPRVNTTGSLSLDAQTGDEGIGQRSGFATWQMQPAHPKDTLSEQVKNMERLGGKLFTDHRYQEALQVYQQALALDPGNATIWMALGDTFLACEQYPEALNAYEKSIALNPKDADAWTNCGTVLEILGRRREAQACYEHTSQLRDEEIPP